MQTSKRGSAMVESAMVLPLVFLIVAQIITASLGLSERVRARSTDLVAETAETVRDRMVSDEDMLRGRWVLQ